ncbi:DegT/DnrJ/EryC1/StrS family aminotransferase [Silvimonas amylolytica]|uniref:Glutamine--scyllo-inositol aminotransferase n=1 Tax=Silvimonas amylolytica TaxID=449663 RepID=A0ABQ2PH13_9NEIS|nr:DegT/DnrJ/EryC1/StrS family aminotransferase [Silvimonas amylolytica]GGP24603.1 glutamine--scyllo-inositol aminotransferase [Silvimonas amylolytica]
MSPTQARILYTKPSITDREISYATDAAANGWGERCYDYINRFERDFAAWIGATHAIATSSCTGAMHMALAALDIGAGDEVILADTNWIATVAPIVHVGATPVFVDVLPQSWCLDPARVEAAITPRTRAIVATHIYGNLCEMDALAVIAERHGLVLIEDAAEAIGSVFHGRRAGSIGRFGVFSFHGTKTMTTGEGGMFVTSDPDLYERVLTLSNHGRKRGETRQFWPAEIGFKYKMSNIQAAIGCAQLERIDELVARKREVFHQYQAALRAWPQISLNPEPAGTLNGYWMPTAVFDPAIGVTREQLQAAFQREQIDARVFFSPLSSTPPFVAMPENRVAFDIPTRAINLPSYHDLTLEQIERVAACLLSVLPEVR